MRESRPYGSVRGVLREGHPYRDPYGNAFTTGRMMADGLGPP